MSSTRRTASETNILAMLDRHESGGPVRRLLRGLRGMPVMAWYGTAGVLVLGLVGSLAWLARDNGTSVAADGAPAGAAVSGAPAVAASPPANASVALSADASAEVVSEADAGPADPAPAAGATIVDLAPAASTPPAEALPALRVLPPQEHAGRILPRNSRSASQRDRPRDPQRLSAAAAPRTGGKPAAPARAQAQAHAEARLRRNPAAPKQAPAAVDTDVALITAIIQHASKRQDAEEEARKP